MSTPAPIIIGDAEYIPRPLEWDEHKRLMQITDDIESVDHVLTCVWPNRGEALGRLPTPQVKRLFAAVMQLTNGDAETEGN